MTSTAEVTTAQKRWELENNIHEDDKIYDFDMDKYIGTLTQQPWKNSAKYFQKVRISAIGLIKMTIHARSGGDLEVMGLLQGKVIEDTFYIMDTIPLAVEATETTVNASLSSQEYISQFLTLSEKIGKKEQLIGWYHSHPAYGCWLSGTDVTTQSLQQKFNEPWLAIVIDPKRTMASGKVVLGAYRTYPENYTPPEDQTQELQSVPLNKIEDYGYHYRRYYQLNDVQYFKSSKDKELFNLLFHKFWIDTLASSPIHFNREYASKQIMDLANKIEHLESKMSTHSMAMFASNKNTKEKEDPLLKLSKDSIQITTEQMNGMISQVIKDSLFNIQKEYNVMNECSDCNNNNSDLMTD